MGFALSLLLSVVAVLPVSPFTADRAWVQGPQGPPFLVEWRYTSAGTRTLEVVSRWADGGAITLALTDATNATPRVTASFAVQAQRTFAWNPGGHGDPTGPMRITATWRDPTGRAGGTATAVWPEPPPAAAPAFAPMPPVRLHGLHLDQAITLP